MKYLFIIALLAGCGRMAEQTTRVNQNFEVDTLFEHDGCKVYRFSDAGNFRYFTNCHGSTQWTEHCGKSCTRSMGIEGGNNG